MSREDFDEHVCDKAGIPFVENAFVWVVSGQFQGRQGRVTAILPGGKVRVESSNSNVKGEYEVEPTDCVIVGVV